MWSRLDVKPISRAHLAKAYMFFLALGFQDATCFCCLLPFWPPAHILTSCRSGFLYFTPKYRCLGQSYPELPTCCKLEAKVQSGLSLI